VEVGMRKVASGPVGAIGAYAPEGSGRWPPAHREVGSQNAEMGKGIRQKAQSTSRTEEPILRFAGSDDLFILREF